MRTLTLDELEQNPGVYTEIHQVLERGGLVCLPCNGTYRIVVDLNNVDAVTKLYQSKRRVRKAPSLIFVDDKAMLKQVADEVPESVQPLVDLWPGPLTILFDIHVDVPKKVRKQLGKGKVGVRIPNSPLMQSVVRMLGRPVLVSSANREKKQGAGSPAQIRKNFGNLIDLFIDAGDLQKEDSSTVVDVLDGKVHITRPGAFEAELLQAFL